MKYAIGISVILVLAGLMAFSVVDTSGIFSRRMEKVRYDSRMTEFHKKKQKECRDAAMDLARARVDSVLSGTKKLLDVDTFLLLPRPTKPERPDLDLTPDTLKVDPIFDRDTN